MEKRKHSVSPWNYNIISGTVRDADNVPVALSPGYNHLANMLLISAAPKLLDIVEKYLDSLYRSGAYRSKIWKEVYDVYIQACGVRTWEEPVSTYKSPWDYDQENELDKIMEIEKDNADPVIAEAMSRLVSPGFDTALCLHAADGQCAREENDYCNPYNCEGPTVLSVGERKITVDDLIEIQKKISEQPVIHPPKEIAFELQLERTDRWPNPVPTNNLFPVKPMEKQKSKAKVGDGISDNTLLFMQLDKLRREAARLKSLPNDQSKSRLDEIYCEINRIKSWIKPSKSRKGI